MEGEGAPSKEGRPGVAASRSSRRAWDGVKARHGGTALGRGAGAECSDG